MRPLELVRKLLLGRKRYRWDKEYASGRWDYLNESIVAESYDAVLQVIARNLAGDRSILELGCGEGILQTRMPRDTYSRFLGVDISKVAIRKAQRFKDDKTDYRVGNMETYVPSGKWNMIIFNEVLFYTGDPLGLVKRYVPYLQPAGTLLVALRETPDALDMIHAFDKAFHLRDQQYAVNQRGAWHCKLYSQVRPGTTTLIN
ncbi:MAG TPA: methyltransferase domain-containing protein [Puia sp.]|nr:methyltransferase domain-containing protein [Puia sp.]